MRSRDTLLAAAAFCLLAAALSAAAATGVESAKTAICNVLFNIRDFLYAIAGGVATLVITLQGIKWIGSAEDPGLRKQAKQGIIHAVVGLIIVLLASWIVIIVFGSTCA